MMMLVLMVWCGVTGCGGYADNRSGASSTTGDGEAFMKTCLAKHMAVLMEQGLHAVVILDSLLFHCSNTVGWRPSCYNM